MPESSIKEGKKKDPTKSELPAYSPPRIITLGESHSSAGTGPCTDGSLASGSTCNTGTGASSCNSGNGAG